MSKNQTPPTLTEVLNTLRPLKAYLHEQWGITKLGIFGSVARGEATPESDIDILYEYQQPLGFALVDFGDFLEERLGRPVDLLSKKAVRAHIWAWIAPDVRDV